MITFPLTLPTTPDFKRATLSVVSVVARTESIFTLQSQVQAFAGQRWEGSFVLPTMVERAVAEPWIAFLTKLNGMQGTFEIGDPLGRTPRGSVPGAPAINGASQTGLELLTDGWTATQTGILLEGDYIQVSDGTTKRLHKVVADASSDGSGLATLDIWPRLRESPTDGSSIVVSNTLGTFRLASNVSAWAMRPGTVWNLGFDVVEAF